MNFFCGKRSDRPGELEVGNPDLNGRSVSHVGPHLSPRFLSPLRCVLSHKGTNPCQRFSSRLSHITLTVVITAIIITVIN